MCVPVDAMNPCVDGVRCLLAESSTPARTFDPPGSVCVSFARLQAALARRKPGQPIPQDEFFECLRSRAARDRSKHYESQHPDIRLRFLRHTRGVDDSVELILHLAEDAPAEDDIVHLQPVRSATPTPTACRSRRKFSSRLAASAEDRR